MSRLRVGVFISNDFKPEHGGGYSYYSQIINSIDKFDFDERLEFIFFSIDVNINKTFNKKYFKIDTQGKTRKQKIYEVLNKGYFRVLLKLLLLFKILKKQKSEYKIKVESSLKHNEIDIIYYPIPMHLELNYPFIYTHWDNGHKIMYPFPEVSMHGIYEARKKSVETTLIKAFAVFCESEAGRNEVIGLYQLYPEKIFIVPLPPGKVIDVRISVDEQNKILDTYQLKSNNFFFYPAQFWAHKNHYNLILAFKEFSSLHPDFKLVLTGSDQGNFNYIKSVVTDLNLQERVVFTGFTKESAIYTFYKHTVSLVMPTFLGPTNMPLIEAQNLGCKVICSDLRGHREMLKDRATYIDPKNYKSIVEAMKLHYRDGIRPEAVENTFFNLKNSLKYLEKNIIEITPTVKTFGLESF